MDLKLAAILCSMEKMLPRLQKFSTVLCSREKQHWAKVGYVGETDVLIDTSAQGYSWSNEVLNKQQFEDGLRRDEQELSDEELDKLPISVEINGEWQTFPDAAAADEALNATSVPEAAGNFHITDDDLGRSLPIKQ